MKPMCPRMWSGWVTPALALALSTPADAQPSENGLWHINGINLPSRLCEVFDNGSGTRTGENSTATPLPGERLVDTYFPSPVTIATADLVLNNGMISGALFGSYTVGDLGTVTIQTPLGGMTGYVNAARDVLILPDSKPDQHAYNVLTRHPTLLTLADVAGTWKFSVVDIPNDLTEAFIDTTTEAIRSGFASETTAAEGEVLYDTSFATVPMLFPIHVTIDTLGNVSTDQLGDGTLVIDPDNSVDVTLAGDTLTFHTNAACDLVTQSSRDLDFSSHTIGVKIAPSLPPLANLEGVWRAQVLHFPLGPVETYIDAISGATYTATSYDDVCYYPDELLHDITFTTRPEMTVDLVSINAAGEVSGSLQGSLIEKPDNHRYRFDSSNGASMLWYANASCSSILSYETAADHLRMTLLIKVAAEAAESYDKLVDLQHTMLPGNQMSFQWNPASSFRVVQSPDPTGGWSPVPGSNDSGSFTIDTSQARRMLYRVETVDP